MSKISFLSAFSSSSLIRNRQKTFKRLSANFCSAFYKVCVCVLSWLFGELWFEFAKDIAFTYIHALTSSVIASFFVFVKFFTLDASSRSRKTNKAPSKIYKYQITDSNFLFLRSFSLMTWNFFKFLMKANHTLSADDFIPVNVNKYVSLSLSA